MKSGLVLIRCCGRGVTSGQFYQKGKRPLVSQSKSKYSWNDASIRDRGPIPTYFYVPHPETILQPQTSASETWAGMLALTGLNVGVFVMWNSSDTEQLSKDEEEWMLGNFTINATNITQGRVWTPLTASVSHQSGMHLVGNLFALWLFGFRTYRVIGSTAFWGLYGAGGVACSLAHVGHNIYTGRTQPPLSYEERKYVEQILREQINPRLGFRHPSLQLQEVQKRLRYADMPSLGASGSVMAISAVSAALFPLDRVRVHPRMIFYIPLPVAVSLYVVSDLLGITTQMLNDDNRELQADNVDHAGHLGGLIMGMYYVTRAWYGRKGSFQFLQQSFASNTKGDLPIVFRAKQMFGFGAKSTIADMKGHHPRPTSYRGRFRL